MKNPATIHFKDFLTKWRLMKFEDLTWMCLYTTEFFTGLKRHTVHTSERIYMSVEI